MDQKVNPRKILKILEELNSREDQYIKFMKELQQQKQKQATSYLQSIQNLSTSLQTLFKKENQLTQKEFSFVNKNYLKSLEDKTKRNYKKKLYTEDDIQKIALHIQIKFMYFTPFLDDYLTGYYPKSFRIKFMFHRTMINSELITYSNGDTQQELFDILENQYPFVLQLQKSKRPFVYQVHIQLSKQKNKHELIELIEFIERDCLNIQLWDQDSNFIYGQMKIPLAQLLYYEKSQDIWTEGFQIFSQLKNQIIGKMDVQFKNYKTTLNSQNMHTKQKLKIKSKQPIQLTSNIEYDIHSASEKERRMLRRINKYKEQANKNEGEINENNHWQKEHDKRKLQQIYKLKEMNKEKMASEIVSRLQNEEMVYQCEIGRPKIMPMKFVNFLRYGQIFYIRIEGLDKSYRELNVITNQNQWEYFCKKYNYEVPANYDLIQPKSQSFYASSQQQITLLFKFLSWRKNKTEREIKCQIINQETQEVMQMCVFKVKVIEPSIDHTFRVYDYFGAEINLNIEFKKLQQYPNSYLYSDYKELEYQWNRSNEQLYLKFKSKKSMKILVFIYTNNMMFSLVKCYQIQVHLYPKIDVNKIIIGKQTDIKIQLPLTEKDQEVIFYTSNPNISWVNYNQKKKIMLKKDVITYINFTLRTFNFDEQIILINCLEYSTRQILFQWYTKIKPQHVEYKSIVELVSSTKKQIRSKFEVANTKNKKTTLALISSNSAYIRFEKNKKQLHAHEAAQVQAIVLPHSESIKQVIVNVSDREQNINYNILFKITYQLNYKDVQQQS